MYMKYLILDTNIFTTHNFQKKVYIFILINGFVIFSFFSLFRAYAFTTLTFGDMEITSQLMTLENNIYVARGGVKVTQKDTTLTADRGVYDRNIEVVKAFDNVVVTQPDATLTSDYLEAYVKEDRILARGNPKLIRIVERESKYEDGTIQKRKTKVILTCDEVEGYNKENRYVAKGNVYVIEVQYREAETESEARENEKKPLSELKCEILEIFSNEDKAIARNNVEIRTKNLQAFGDRAIYLEKEKRLIIVGNAHAIQINKETPTSEEQVSELYANKIIYYPEEDRSIAVGNVKATVYPKGSSPTASKDEKKKKDKKKQEKEDQLDVKLEEKNDSTISYSENSEKQNIKTSSDTYNSYDNQAKTLKSYSNLPAGRYTEITQESSEIDHLKPRVIEVPSSGAR